MSKQFRVKRTQHQRLDIGGFDEMLDLFGPADHEITSVKICGTFSPTGDIDLLVRSAAGDPVVLDAGKFSRAIGMQERSEVIEIQIVSDVTVKVSVSRVARITFLCAPDLLAGFAIPSESSGTRRREARGEDGVPRSWITKHQAVRIKRKPAQLSLLQIIFQAGEISAFRKPDSSRFPSKITEIIVAGDLNLGADRFVMLFHQRKEPVGRRAGDDLEKPTILKRLNAPTRSQCSRST